MNDNYQIVPIRYGDDYSMLIELVKDHPFLVNYRYYLKRNWFEIENNICALALYEAQTLIGATLLLIHRDNELIVGNISCTYIIPSKRGKHLSSLLIESAKQYCDVLLDLTPVDSIIKMMERASISNFVKIGTYQLQMLRNVVHKEKGISIKTISDEKNGMFVRKAIIDVLGKELSISFYSFRRKGLLAAEVIHVSNRDLFSNSYRQILSVIKRKMHIHLFFVDDIFLTKQIEGALLSNKKDVIRYLRNLFLLIFSKTIKIKSRKYLWVRDQKINFKINYLFTEYCFRR